MQFGHSPVPDTGFLPALYAIWGALFIQIDGRDGGDRSALLRG